MAYGTLYKVCGIRYTSQTIYHLHNAACTICHIPYTTYHRPRTTYHIPYTKCLIPFTIYHILHTIQHIPQTTSHIPYTRFHIIDHTYHIQHTAYHTEVLVMKVCLTNLVPVCISGTLNHVLVLVQVLVLVLVLGGSSSREFKSECKFKINGSKNKLANLSHQKIR